MGPEPRNDELSDESFRSSLEEHLHGDVPALELLDVKLRQGTLERTNKQLLRDPGKFRRLLRSP